MNYHDFISIAQKAETDAGKVLVAAAITDKGVSTAASDSFATMASNIGSIESGGSGGSTGAHVVNGVFAAGTSATISCTSGNLLVCFCVQRYAISVPSGWTLLHTDAGIESAQWCYTLYKTAASTSETFQADTTNATRTFVSIFEISGAGTPSYVNEAAAAFPIVSVTRSNNGLTLWGFHVYSYNAGATGIWYAQQRYAHTGLLKISNLQSYGDNNRAASFADESPSSQTLEIWTVNNSGAGRITQIYIPNAA